MLSRVAESLYWMARYIEQAEDLTRLLVVNFNALLDSHPDVARQGWESVIRASGDQTAFAENYKEVNAQTVIQFMFWDPLNSNSVTSCITKARENARSVREQMSSEMWEAINRLYHLTRNTERAKESNPIDFFKFVRDRAQSYQGVVAATMTHGEPYQFIQLGLHLERADKTVRILDAKYLHLNGSSQSAMESSLQLMALLRSCSAFEPYRRTATGELELEKVAEYLLLNPEFPRAVFFCIHRCLQTLDGIGEDPVSTVKNDSPRRLLGRLKADLEYLDIHEVLGENMDPFLARLLLRLNSIGDEISRTYFNTSIILPDERPRQQQQQQQ